MYDVIIVGGGPAGLTAAIYLLRACKKVLVIEKEVFGGQITKSSLVENYPGCPNISGMKLGNMMYDQAKDLGMEALYGEVTSISKENDLFSVFVGKEKYQSKSIIYAAGVRPRKLEIENESKLLGKGVSYCATCDGAFFKDKTVCVIGGGNTAIDDALYLSNICKKVYLIHRREEFRAEPLKVTHLKQKENVEFFYHAVVQDILGEEKVEKVKILVEDLEKELEVDGVFVAVGSVPNTQILKDFLSISSNGYLFVNHQLETSIPGFFVAGDVREKTVRQLTTAVCDGTIAAMEVIQYLED